MRKETNQQECRQQEYMDTLNTLWKQNRNLKNLQYFLNIAYWWFDKKTRRKCRPEIVVAGASVPEEIIWAAGCAPYWILGGSYEAVRLSDDRMPRDADPVSRSVAGFLYETDGVDYLLN